MDDPQVISFNATVWRKRRPKACEQPSQQIGIQTILKHTAWIYRDFEQHPRQLIDDWLATCEAAARAGGQELLAWQGRFQTRKKGIRDLVTDADLASQDAIRRIVMARFPDHAFVGEEQGTKSTTPSANQLTWIVDPLDGTTNYVHGYPNFAVSVAIARGNDVQAGVIYDPLRDQCFAAAAGKGAWCNGTQLKTSDVSVVAEALVAVSLPRMSIVIRLTCWISSKPPKYLKPSAAPAPPRLIWHMLPAAP